MIEVVGLGPGGEAGRTKQAEEALTSAEILVGYSAYIELVRDRYPQKPVVENGMRGERERCAEALRLSREGRHVALVCSGDAQVYGMASLLLEMSGEEDEVRIVPGVTAAISAAALLGAPLSGDFATISLSDYLTPWPVIEKRLRYAALAGFPIALYNPVSRARAGHLAKACAILMEVLDATTPCGWARLIGRKGEKSGITTLGELPALELDMFTTVIIGSTGTIVRNGRLLTPRGYAL